MPTFSVLLVGPDAERWASQAGAADVTAAPDVESARAYLSGTAFDAVWVQDGLPVTGLRALRDALGLSMPVETVASSEDVAGRLGSGGEASAADVQRTLGELRAEMSRVAHALNNPLSVITGNAQLGREMATALGVDEDVVGAFDQIQLAADELGALFREVAELRRRIDRLLV